MSRKRKSPLMTPDPYHTPGYCGYVPQIKYEVGNTFGSHTHQLLTSGDPKVATSGNPVLSDIHPNVTPLPKTAEDFFSSPVYQNRSRSWGDQKYVPQMVPGYEGFIPKKQHFFGSRYAETCHHAISYFESDQYRHQLKREQMRAHARSQTYPQQSPQQQQDVPTHPATPLRPIATKARPFLTQYDKDRSLTNKFMPDLQPNDFHISGYTGFVPRNRKLIGLNYPTSTCYALQEHVSESKRLEQSMKEPIQVVRPLETNVVLTGIYPKDTGILPCYTGHIPGQKFKYGQTFGTSTQNAVPSLTV